MYNQKFTVTCDFVDSFLNRVILQQKYNNEEIVNDAKIFEACVNLNPFNINFSECGLKRDKVAAFIESNDLNSFKQQVAETCTAELLEAHSLAYLQHRNNFSNIFSNVMNQVALRDSLDSLNQCISKI
jgi:hypothetical protein